MAVLSHTTHMKRVLVIGSGGSGKSTFARRLGKLLDIEVKHLDSFYWRAGWTKPGKDSWIIDGNFGGTLELRVRHCDTIVFLDMSRLLCLWRVVKRRLIYRNRSRPDMSAGCKEKIDLEFLGWIWDYANRSRPKVVRLLKEHSASKRVVWLRSDSEVERFLEDHAGTNKTNYQSR